MAEMPLSSSSADKTMKSLSLLVALSILSLISSCNSEPPKPTKPVETKPVEYSYEVVNVYPHDRNAFTQGLVFRDGKLLESTGQEGQSSLRSVDLQTGQVIKKVDLDSQYFGEGLTVLNGKIYQLTWQHRIGFIYDSQTFQQIGQFPYAGEGWGLTNDGKSLIVSDGTNRLRFIDPDSFRVTKTIAVTDRGTAIRELNELEYIQGEIYANIWHDNRIAAINPDTGAVTGWLDCSGIVRLSEATDQEAVLNGIAFDEASGRVFVTGKLWPKLFEVKIKK